MCLYLCARVCVCGCLCVCKYVCVCLSFSGCVFCKAFPDDNGFEAEQSLAERKGDLDRDPDQHCELGENKVSLRGAATNNTDVVLHMVAQNTVRIEGKK